MSTTKIFFLAFGTLLLCAIGFTLFLEFHEARAHRIHWQFDDPAFWILPVHDVSLPIFSITYGSMIAYLAINRKQPYLLSRPAFSYAILLAFRTITLTLLPLKEPDSFVFLDDPFLNNFVYQSTIKADLFFSGHTALLCLIIFLTEKYKWIFVILGVIIGILLMIQRVHYSIDILAALPFAYISVKLADKLLERLTKPR